MNSKLNRNILNNFFLFSAQAIIITYLQVFLRNKNFNHTDVGFLSGVFQISGAIGIFIMSNIAKKWGIFKELLIFNSSLSVLFFYLLYTNDNFVISFIACFFLGFTFWCLEPLTDTILTFTLKENYERDYGIVRSFGTLGFVMANFLIDLFSVIDSDSNQSIFKTGVIIIAFYIFISSFVPFNRKLYKNEENEKSYEIKDQSKLFILIFIVVFLNNLAFQNVLSFSNLYLKEVVHTDKIAFMMALMAFPEIPILFFSNKLIKKFKLHNLLLIAPIGTFLRIILMTTFPNIMVYSICQLMHITNFIFPHIALLNYSRLLLNSKNRVLAIAFYGIFSNRLANFISSYLGGYLIDTKGYTFNFYFFSSFSVLALIICLFIYKKLKNREES